MTIAWINQLQIALDTGVPREALRPPPRLRALFLALGALFFRWRAD